MKGFNIHVLISILLGSMMLAGCIPQAKKTECSNDEAYNSSLRACVPVTPNQESFIKFSSATPSAPVTVSATSPLPINLSFMVNNPYARSYRVRWTRSFNGQNIALYSPSAPSSNLASHPWNIDLVPVSDLLGAIGTHVITAQILDGSLNVLDTKEFQIVTTNNPTPFANGFLPVLTVPVNRTPVNSINDNFTLTVFRNGASLSTPQVVWTLDKLTGTPASTRTQTNNISFPTPTTGVNVTFSINSQNPMANVVPPSAPYSSIVGSYRLTASIIDGVTLYASYSWDYTISHPALGVVSNAFNPLTSATIDAFNGAAYNNLYAKNFSYSNRTTKAQMCVTVSTPGGRYGGGTSVRFYLGNSAVPIYNGTTNPALNTICLSDADAATQALIAFTDANPDATWTSSVRARVFDIDTHEEYTTFTGSTYPPTWRIDVYPTNKAPTVTFEDLAADTVICASTNAAGTIRYGCPVTQSNTSVNNSIVVAFRVTDDHYTLPGDDDKLAYSATLTRSGAVIDSTSCNKDFSQFGSETSNLPARTISDYVGPVYRCRFDFPSFDGTGSINPLLDTWAVNLTVTDNGSPLGTTLSDRRSSNLVWNFNVRELNTAPSVSANISLNASPYTAITTATELNTIAFNVTFADPERDPYRLELRRCAAGSTPTSCLSPSSPLVSSTTAYYSDGDYGSPTPNRRVTYTIPDGFVDDVATPTTIYFQLRTIDIASTATAVNGSNVVTVNNTVDTILALAINNDNPPPVFANPAAINTNPLGIDYRVISSFPLTLDPGTVTDASAVAAEANITYRWLISSNGGASWTTITGATARILRWTPGTDIQPGNYEIIACATDGSPLRPNALTPGAVGANCNQAATVKVEPNSSLAALPTSATGKSVVGAPAIWVDTSASGTIPSRPNSRVVYTAMPVDDGSEITIVMNKFYYNSDNEGKMEFIESFEFEPVNGSTITEVRDLSITGDANNLYVGYLAYIGVAPATYRPQVRRLVKTFSTTVAPGGKTGYAHPAPFGYSYSGFTASTNPDCLCWETGTSLGYTVTDGTAVLDASLLFAAGGNAVILNGRSLAVSGTNGATLAASIEAAINGDMHVATAGIIAKASGDQVLITGPIANDQLQINNNSLQMGKLFINGGVLHIPYINSSLAGGNTNKITIATYAVDSVLALPVASETNLTAFTAASQFTNVLDNNGNLLLALVSSSTPGAARMVKFTGVDLTTGVQYNIFSGQSMSYLDLSPDVSGNPNYHVLGKAISGHHWITRIPVNMSNLTVMYRMEDTTDGTTASTLVSNTFFGYKIATARPRAPLTSTTEARVLMLTQNAVYAFRAQADNQVNCGNCLSIIKSDQEPIVYSTMMPLVATDVFSNVTIGTGGNSSTENMKNIMLFGFIGEDTTVPGNERFNLGLINSDTEVINSTTANGTGLWFPAIFK